MESWGSGMLRSRSLAFIWCLAIVVCELVGACGGGATTSVIPTSPTTNTGTSSPVPTPIPTLASVVLSAERTTFRVGGAVRIIPSAVDSTGNQKEIPSSEVKWSSSGPAVTVSSTGLATAMAAGNAKVTGEYQGKVGELEIVVEPSTTPAPTPAPRFAATIYGGVYYGSQFSAIVVPNALAEFISSQPGCSAQTTTDSNGLYRLNVPCSVGKFRVSHPRYGDQNYEVILKNGEEYRSNILFTPRP